ncbi:MAG: hypothetical protein IKF68_06535 [Erysipelotrichaceae bacterium]|nr:hypothetical protein [Erysipelotrichaceae bacterium]
MQVLSFIDRYIVYAYILMAAVILVLLIRLMKKAGSIGITMKPLNEDIEHINKGLKELNEKKEIIDHTVNVSIPFFVRIFFLASVLWMALNDFFDTRSSKRSIGRSLRKAFRYQELLRENRTLRKVSGR